MLGEDNLETANDKKTILLKLSLYMISLWILFFMLIVLKVDVSDIPFKINCSNIKRFIYKNIFSLICILFVLFGVAGYILFKDLLKNAKQLPIKLKECESINYENLSFLATYIIPLVCFPMQTDREIFVMFAVIIIIGCIFVKTNLYYTNPSLVLLGFNVYKVKTDSQKFREGIIIVRGKLISGDDVQYLSLSDNVYFGRRVKR